MTDKKTVTIPKTGQERNFPSLDLSTTTMLNTNNNQPILVIQSPKTPTLSRKLKAVSLDSDPVKAQISLELNRDVSSMPNTPKRQLKQKQIEFDENSQKFGMGLGSNLKRFASNTSISGSQTLKTLPEVMTLQDFSDSKPEPVRIKAKGLLERRGSNASLTIDLGSNSSLSENKPNNRFNTTKSASHLNLSTFSSDKCSCELQTGAKKNMHRFTLPPDGCNTNGGQSRNSLCKNRCYTFHKKCNCLCNFKCRRKSLSNENLYVPPCSFCQMRSSKECGVGSRSCKGCRRAMYPRQPELESSHILSEDFKLHLQNIQYLQTAGSVLSVSDLRASCEPLRVPKLHQEFWEVPLNLQEKCLVSGTQSKNRYKGVLPNEHSRVHLMGSSGYIHANYIKGPDYSETAYIATQGPMEHTCEDFWDMIWSSQCKCIVMLTGLIEKGKSKCELYFPLGKSSHEGTSYFYITTTRPQEKFTFDLKNTQRHETEIVAFEELDELKYGNYKITFSKKENLGECVVREFYLCKGDLDRRKIFHYWFSNWQDHKMANPNQVLEIALHTLELTSGSKDNNNICNSDHRICDKSHVNVVGFMNIPSSNDEAKDGRLFNKPFEAKVEKPRKAKESVDLSVPIVVHCSAGIGRTGCFLAILNGIRQLRSNFNVDILAILCSLRLNRGGMVQTAEQYELIHRVLSLYSDRM